VAETPLLKVFNLDKLNYNNDPQTGGDGFFDFVQGITVDSQNGRLIFTTKEPFGNYYFQIIQHGIRRKLRRCSTYNPNQKNMFIEICIAIHNQVRCRTSIKINFY
jgi:cell surface protein SprA